MPDRLEVRPYLPSKKWRMHAVQQMAAVPHSQDGGLAALALDQIRRPERDIIDAHHRDGRQASSQTDFEQACAVGMRPHLSNPSGGVLALSERPLNGLPIPGTRHSALEV